MIASPLTNSRAQLTPIHPGGLSENDSIVMLDLSLVDNYNCSECGVRNWDCEWKESESYYFGRINVTDKGKTCLAWDSVTRKDNPFPKETHNYCREHGFRPPECFTSTRGKLHLSSCGIRSCMECDSGELASIRKAFQN